MERLRVALFVTVTLILSAISTGQTVSVSAPTGSLSVLENQIVNGERQITLLCQGSPDMSVLIQATSGTNPIRYIQVGSVRTGSNNNHVVVSVVENGGTISYLRLFEPVSVFPSPDAEVLIGSIQISGVLGDPGSPHTSFVFADVVAEVTAAGGVTADIQSGPRLFGGTSTITFVRSTSDGISGDILARGALSMR